MQFRQNTDTARRVLESLGADVVKDKPLPHVTELVYCLTRSYYDRTDPLPLTPVEAMLFSVGKGLEDVLLAKYETSHQGEVDGIHFEADVLDLDGVPAELKTTRVSSSRPPEELSETWFKQILAYMKCLDVNHYGLLVLHLMGSYKPPLPELVYWEVTATQEEMDGNWRWLLDRRSEYMHYHKIKLPPPPFSTNRDWECQNCRYRMRCEVKANEMGIPVPDYFHGGK